MKLLCSKTGFYRLAMALALWMLSALSLSGGQEASAAGDLWGVWFSTQSQTCKGTGAKMRCRVRGLFTVSNQGELPSLPSASPSPSRGYLRRT